ncbi:MULTISPECIES: glycosyltransferase [Caldimonas]|uniref:glycosyltransferase n=1 Tax=Caldimonas TaxID=196013 RepID=UPI0003701E5D|nr:glycosyltransferase [Caldimonas manganoxidans]
MAIDLVDAALSSARTEPLLVLRRKPQTPRSRIDALKERGMPVATVASWPHALTVWQLVRLCRKFRPQVLVAHGFSEHLWGRYAGLWAKVPALVHVEHNSRERYTPWRLAQARWLARRTARIVGVSEGVREQLLRLGFPQDRTVAIPNGIRLERFAQADEHPLEAREPGIVMAARFAKQKDHATLLQAIAVLKTRGWTPPVWLAGGGKPRHLEAAQQLCHRLGLDGQVHFLGHCSDLPGLLMSQRICVLSTHYEGMPLSLVEGMAAGCAVVGTAVPGVRELIDHGHNGLLVPHEDPVALADALCELLSDAAKASRLARQGRQTALNRHGLDLMQRRYETLFLALAGSTSPHA